MTDRKKQYRHGRISILEWAPEPEEEYDAYYEEPDAPKYWNFAKSCWKKRSIRKIYQRIGLHKDMRDHEWDEVIDYFETYLEKNDQKCYEYDFYLGPASLLLRLYASNRVETLSYEEITRIPSGYTGKLYEEVIPSRDGYIQVTERYWRIKDGLEGVTIEMSRGLRRKPASEKEIIDLAIYLKNQPEIWEIILRVGEHLDFTEKEEAILYNVINEYREANGLENRSDEDFNLSLCILRLCSSKKISNIDLKNLEIFFHDHKMEYEEDSSESIFWEGQKPKLESRITPSTEDIIKFAIEMNNEVFSKYRQYFEDVRDKKREPCADIIREYYVDRSNFTDKYEKRYCLHNHRPIYFSISIILSNIDLYEGLSNIDSDEARKIVDEELAKRSRTSKNN